MSSRLLAAGSAIIIHVLAQTDRQTYEPWREKYRSDHGDVELQTYISRSTTKNFETEAKLTWRDSDYIGWSIYICCSVTVDR